MSRASRFKKIRFPDESSDEDNDVPPPPPEDEEESPPLPIQKEKEKEKIKTQEKEKKESKKKPSRETKQDVTPSPSPLAPVFPGKTTSDCYSVIADDTWFLLQLYEKIRLSTDIKNVDDLKKLYQNINVYPKDSVDYKNAVSIARSSLWQNLKNELATWQTLQNLKLESEYEFLVDLYETLGKKFKFSPLYTRKKYEVRKKAIQSISSFTKLKEYNALLTKEIIGIRNLNAAHIKKLLD